MTLNFNEIRSIDGKLHCYGAHRKTVTATDASQRKLYCTETEAYHGNFTAMRLYYMNFSAVKEAVQLQSLSKRTFTAMGLPVSRKLNHTVAYQQTLTHQHETECQTEKGKIL